MVLFSTLQISLALLVLREEGGNYLSQLSKQLLSGEKQSQIHNSLHLERERAGLLQQHFATRRPLSLINSDETQLHVEEAANSRREERS